MRIQTGKTSYKIRHKRTGSFLTICTTKVAPKGVETPQHTMHRLNLTGSCEWEVGCVELAKQAVARARSGIDQKWHEASFEAPIVQHSPDELEVVRVSTTTTLEVV